MPHLNPRVQDEIKGIELSDGRELRVLLIGGPMFPEQIRDQPKAAVRMAIKGARLARERGAEAFGLGAFWSTVGDKGLEIQKAVPSITITNGGAYTAGTIKAAIPGLMKSFELEGGTLKQSCAAVVGANGVVAFGVARTIAPEVAKLILIGRNLDKLERSATSLRQRYPETNVVISTHIGSCAEADLIFSATSDPFPVLYPKHVKPGAWVFDIGRPADADPSICEIPGVHLIPGGVVKPPGEMQTHLDLHFGHGMIPACMAETMIMTATKAFERKSLGSTTRNADIDFYLEEGERLGFEIITRDERVAKVYRISMSEAFRTRAISESLEADLLWQHGCQGLMQDGEHIVAYFPSRIDLPLRGSWESIQDIDYVKQYFDTLEPIVLKHLIIAPTHHQVQANDNQQVIWLDPGMAFGTGHHETTYMALETLETLELKNKTVLDVGTGSGILAMAAHLLGSPKVTGIDIDPQAVIVAKENAKLNKLVLDLYEGTIEGQSDQGADMIVANLFAELHVLLASHYARVLKPDGMLIITGILSEKSPMVLEALKMFTLQETKSKGEWTLFSFKLIAHC